MIKCTVEIDLGECRSVEQLNQALRGVPGNALVSTSNSTYVNQFDRGYTRIKLIWWESRDD